MKGSEKCALCLNNAANHKRSHFIPRGLWNELRISNPKIIYKNSHTKPFEERKYGGDYYYDDFLYCKECEAYFSKLDEYGVRVLRTPDIAKVQVKSVPLIYLHRNGLVKQKKYELHGLNYELFARFIYSLFFRIHCSRQSSTSQCKFTPSFSAFLRDLVSQKLSISDLTLPIIIRNNYNTKSDLDHVIPPPQIYEGPYAKQPIVQLLVKGIAIYLLPGVFSYEQFLLFLRQDKPVFQGMSPAQFEKLAKHYVFKEFFN